jgi:hypothetical protein
MGSDKHNRLVAEALLLKKAWLLAAAFVGAGVFEDVAEVV